MNTYNFVIFINGIAIIQVDINAYNEDEAIEIIKENYPSEEGFRYMLL